MSFPVPVKYKLTATLDNIVVEYSNGQEWEGLPSPPEGGGGDEISIAGIATNSEPNGAVVLGSSVKIIGEYALAYKPITSIIADAVTTVKTSAFSHTKLTALRLPNATGSDNYISNLCDSCKQLETVVLPAWKKPFYNQCFVGCSKLVSFDTFGFSFTGSNVFKDCSLLNNVILRNPSVVTLSNINHFSGTPFASGKAGGKLFVPAALISTYQSAANWSTILGYENNSIQAIEGSEYEFNYADGTPI